jgi:glutathione-regulated potassium-efflux system ancillary protein KefF
MTNLFTQSEVQDFATRWFKALDVHSTVKELESFLVVDEFVLVVPEGQFDKLAGFSEWYERALHLFFDEEHTLTEVTILSGDENEVTAKIVVNWKASTWKAPEPHSKRIDMDAYQTWVLRPDADGKPRIVRYVVDDVKYAPSSTTL